MPDLAHLVRVGREAGRVGDRVRIRPPPSLTVIASIRRAGLAELFLQPEAGLEPARDDMTRLVRAHMQHGSLANDDIPSGVVPGALFCGIKGWLIWRTH